jgi:hypothetical protein
MLAKPLDATSSFRGLAGAEQLSSLAKVVAFLFVELLDFNTLSRFIDCAFLALDLPFLNLAVNGFPIFRCAVLTEAPFLELTLVFAFAVDGSEEHLSVRSSKSRHSPFHETVFRLHVGHDASKRANLTIFGGVKRAKQISVLLPRVHLGKCHCG